MRTVGGTLFYLFIFSETVHNGLQTSLLRDRSEATAVSPLQTSISRDECDPYKTYTKSWVIEFHKTPCILPRLGTLCLMQIRRSKNRLNILFSTEKIDFVMMWEILIVDSRSAIETRKWNIVSHLFLSLFDQKKICYSVSCSRTVDCHFTLSTLVVIQGKLLSHIIGHAALNPDTSALSVVKIRKISSAI